MSTVDVTAALGAGSGIDIKQLAQNLADVERKPREDAIQARIDKSQGRISGYGAIMFGLKSFKEAFAALNDRSDFGGATVRNSAPGAFDVTASAGAEPRVLRFSVIAIRSAGHGCANLPLHDRG